MNQLKSHLREKYKSLRRKLSFNYQQEISKKICTFISSWELYNSAKHIAIYNAHQREIDLSLLMHQAKGKIFYLPKITSEQNLVFLPISDTTSYEKNIFGIQEPVVELKKAINVELLDIIFMPLVVFDDEGRRIGAGGGYYDRTLANAEKALLVGVAYEFQRFNSLPKQTWDINLKAVITEEKIYWPKSKV